MTKDDQIAAVTPLVGEEWAAHLHPYFFTSGMRTLMQKVKQDRTRGTVFPSSDDTFRAFRETPYSKTRVVIVGQDPYPTPDHADGLAFSARNLPIGSDVPRSLANIFKELEDDIGFSDPVPNPDLTRWAQQGVLLLNTSLTVRKGEIGSHAGIGWQPFTQRVLQIVSDRFFPTMFVAWGNHAKGIIEPYLHLGFHGYVQSYHPSPLSAHRGFFGSKPFSRINQHLVSLDEKPIQWNETSTPTQDG